MSSHVERLKGLVKTAGFDWTPGETSISKLDVGEASKRLGFAFKQKPPADAEMRLQKRLLAAPREACPPQLDWRTARGQNWITSVRDQSSCGSCVAFSTIAATEAQYAIDRADTSLLGDLSEAFVFSCGGGSCTNGWEIHLALDFLMSQGTTDEPCFPYKPIQQACSSRCADWAQRVKKITGWHFMKRRTNARDWLCTQGPLVAGMEVYDDFRYYGGGVYRHVHGQLLGLHAIAVIGYDEPRKAWICKNSWGTGWGEQGFFNIGFNECGMLSRFPMYGITTI